MSNEGVQNVLDIARIKEACAKLGEHFDTVQIFCTREGETRSATVHLSRGVGNWFARYGQLKHYLREIENEMVNSKEEWE
jgi:hypothetical protein